MVNRILLTEELFLSKKEGKLTDKAERLCMTIIENCLSKYSFKNEHLDLYKSNALISCQKNALSFDADLLKDGYPYIVQIVNGSLSNTYKNIQKYS